MYSYFIWDYFWHRQIVVRNHPVSIETFYIAIQSLVETSLKHFKINSFLIGAGRITGVHGSQLVFNRRAAITWPITLGTWKRPLSVFSPSRAKKRQPPLAAMSDGYSDPFRSSPRRVRTKDGRHSRSRFSNFINVIMWLPLNLLLVMVAPNCDEYNCCQQVVCN